MASDLTHHVNRGIVAILDHHVATKAYGRYFLSALPACGTEMIRIKDEVALGEQERARG